MSMQDRAPNARYIYLKDVQMKIGNWCKSSNFCIICPSTLLQFKTLFSFGTDSCYSVALILKISFLDFI